MSVLTGLVFEHVDHLLPKYALQSFRKEVSSEIGPSLPTRKSQSVAILELARGLAKGQP